MLFFSCNTWCISHMLRRNLSIMTYARMYLKYQFAKYNTQVAVDAHAYTCTCTCTCRYMYVLYMYIPLYTYMFTCTYWLNTCSVFIRKLWPSVHRYLTMHVKSISTCKCAYTVHSCLVVKYFRGILPNNVLQYVLCNSIHVYCPFYSEYTVPRSTFSPAASYNKSLETW